MTNKHANEMLIRASFDFKETQLKQAEEEMMKKLQYKQQLQDQMVLNYKEKQHQYEEFLRDKKALDSIIQRIHDEDRMYCTNIFHYFIIKTFFLLQRNGKQNDKIE